MFDRYRRRGAYPTFISVIASALVLFASTQAKAAGENFGSFEQFVNSSLPQDILWKVLARNGKSKTYTDVVPLDGGTIGIANFAVGGLASLYEQMDTQKYFGRTKDDMIKNYSGACRPQGRHGNDTGWGCYSKKWWRTGMIEFVKSPESHDAQNRAWLNHMRSTIELALEHGWKDGRNLAIATGIANSIGGKGFASLAKKHNWQPEQVLAAYVGHNAHRERRRDAINEAFPP